jgi:hypothetical protein
VTGSRVRSDFFVGALRRRAEAAGAYVSVARRGAEEAGAIFIIVDRRDGCFDLYAPAPQSIFESERPADRLFSLVLDAVTESDARTRMDQEYRFDPDLWLIDIEDREGRAFVDIAKNVA